MIRRVGDGQPRDGWFRDRVKICDPVRDVHASLVELEKRGHIVVDTENKTVTITDAGQKAALRPMQEVLPKIQLRGIGDSMTRVRAGFDSLREMIGRVHVARGGLMQDLSDVEEALVQHRKDIRFQAETLGNFSGDIDEKGE